MVSAGNKQNIAAPTGRGKHRHAEAQQAVAQERVQRDDAEAEDVDANQAAGFVADGGQQVGQKESRTGRPWGSVQNDRQVDRAGTEASWPMAREMKK